MFGTLGFSELIIILVIVLIIFGAGRLPQLGEGLGKALKGFKKEVHEVPSETPSTDTPPDPGATTSSQAEGTHAAPQAQTQESPAGMARAPYQPGPEATPGTTAALMASAAPQLARPASAPSGPAPSSAASPTPSSQTPAAGHSAPPPTMEQRMAQPAPVSQGTYPPLPPSARPKPVQKRPSAIVNKEAVARVQAQQAAMKANAAHGPAGKAAQSSGLSPQDMQGLGETLGDTLRTFRQAAADVRNAVDPEMRTIRAEMDAAQKEIEQSMEAARQMPAVHEDPPQSS